jgi:hypothetical protein
LRHGNIGRQIGGAVGLSLLVSGLVTALVQMLVSVPGLLVPNAAGGLVIQRLARDMGHLLRGNESSPQRVGTTQRTTPAGARPRRAGGRLGGERRWRRRGRVAIPISLIKCQLLRLL